MTISRRYVLAAGTATLAFGIGPRALALTEVEAKGWVEVTVAQVRKLLNLPGGTANRAPELRVIMENRANMPLIARYCAGRSWRDMNEAQRKRYTTAFSHYISIIYARRFDEFSDDPQIAIGRAIDAGSKGLLIESPIVLGDGRKIAVEWLVSDRGGRVEIVDLVIEGISMAATQREEIGAMIEKRSGNVDALIEHLATTS